MKIKNIDHLVITTSDWRKCRDFYVGLLGMTAREDNGRYSLLFGSNKINIHTKKGEYQPAAARPEYGSQDFCLIVDDVEGAMSEAQAKGYAVEEGVVLRTGAQGAMRSVYLRDPDGNLVELSEYL